MSLRGSVTLPQRALAGSLRSVMELSHQDFAEAKVHGLRVNKLQNTFTQRYVRITP